MISKKSFLCFLWIFCLPLVSEAGELSTHYSSEKMDLISPSIARAKRTRYHLGCRPKPPVCLCIPGSQGPSSLGTLAYGDFYLSIPGELPPSSPQSELFDPGEVIPIVTPRANLNIQGLSVDPLTKGIIVSVPGVYEISYVVTIIPTEITPTSYTLALQVNGVTVPGSIRSVLASQETGGINTQIQIQGQVLQTLLPGQVVSVINADATSQITLTSSVISPASVEEASLIIRKIDNLP